MKMLQRFAPFVRLMAVALMLFTGLAASRLAAADAPAKSLEYAPADASFYISSLRNREQVERLTSSNFWKQANELDYIKQLRALVTLGIYVPDSPLPKILEELEKPENKEAVKLLTSMVSDEIFLYGDNRWAKSMALANEMQSGSQFVKAMSIEITGEWSDLTEEERTQKLIFNTLAKDPSLIDMSTTVIGFKTDDKKAAVSQLARIEKLLLQLIDETDELAILKGRMKREKAAGSEFLTLTLDAQMVPWEEEIDWEIIEDKDGELDEVRKKINALKVVVSFGYHDGYVLMSISDSLDHIAKLGEGESLATNDKLAPVMAAANEKLTGITYVSEAMAVQSNNTQGMLDSMVDELNNGLKGIAELTDDQKKRLAADLERASTDIKSLVPKPGAQVAYSFMTDEGYESFAYNWSENLYYDGSQPLTLWEHVGKQPLLAFVARTQYRPQNYAMLSDWARKGIGWFEELGLPEMDEEEQKQYKQFAAIAFPLLTRFDHITKEMMIPATADSQAGFVLDAELSSKQWWVFAEPTEKAMAIPLPAILFGVSDTDLFKQALDEYRMLINDSIKAAAQFDNGEFGLAEQDPFEIPLPERQATQKGEVYTYNFFQQAGIDEQLKPTMALAEKPHKLAVFTVAPEQAKKLLKPGAPKFDSGPLANTNRPMAAATYFDFAGMVDVAVPWVEFGVRSYHEDQVMMEQFEADEAIEDGAEDSEEAEDEPELEDIDKEIARRTKKTMRQVRETAKLLKCFRGVTAAVTVEDGVTITHSQMRFVDAE